jgi:dihydroorotase
MKTLYKTPVYSLPYTLSKYLVLGCKLPEVIAATTCNPARLMGLQGKIGTLSADVCGDVAVIFRDSLKEPLI